MRTPFDSERVGGVLPAPTRPQRLRAPPFPEEPATETRGQ